MVRYSEKEMRGFDANGNPVFYGEGSCESTDTKPTDRVATGSIITEVDTKKVFFYSEETEEWVEQVTFPQSE